MSQRQTAKALREKRAQVIADARKILDTAEAENRPPTTEERQKWAELVGDVKRDAAGNPVLGADGKPERVVGEEERLQLRIADLEKQEGLEGSLERPAGRPGPGRDDYDGRHPEQRTGPSEEQRALALQAWVWEGRGLALTEDHRDAAKLCGLNLRAQELSFSLRRETYRRLRPELRGYLRPDVEFRAGSNAPQSGLLTGGGAYTVPEGFVNNLEVALLQYGGIRDVADVMRTTSGNDLPWPTVNDTSVKGRRIAENATITGKDMTFGAIVFHAYKYTSDLVLVPVELIQDTAFNLAVTLGELLGIRVARIQADEFTTGSGAAMPTGLLTAATLGVTAASSTAIAADDLYTLKHSVDPAYRKGPGVGWMFHDQILLAIKKLKDAQGRYLWQTSLAGGAPDTLDSDPITINQSMASTMASGNITLSYGQHSKYKVRDVAEVRMRRLVERYADADQEGFVLFMRSDGNLLDAGTHPVKYHKHP